LKEKLFKNSNFYLILDREVNSYPQLFNIAVTAVKNGVGIIQLRDKKGSADEILKFSAKIKKATGKRALYIVNDRVDLSLVSCADGVHLGQDDLPIFVARKILGKKAVIGVSCQTLAQAITAQKEGADYIGFGSVFKTKTKPQRSPMDLKLLRRVVRGVQIPVFAIGGIDLNNIAVLSRLGVRRVAVCRAICCARNVAEAASSFKRALK